MREQGVWREAMEYIRDDEHTMFYRESRQSASGSRTEIEDFRDDENLRFSNHLTPEQLTIHHIWKDTMTVASPTLLSGSLSLSLSRVTYRCILLVFSHS